MRVSMPAIIDQAGRRFNVDEADGVSRRHNIAAGSPQAKGRIERLWRTLQDRLVVELRLRGLATLEAADAFLPAFLADFNPRFAHPATDPTPP